jgi:hypothetical protein
LDQGATDWFAQSVDISRGDADGLNMDIAMQHIKR